MMVKRKKFWEYIFFLQLFGMACKLPVALNIDMRSAALALVILFLISYFVFFKWWPITEWNKSHFFPARKVR